MGWFIYWHHNKHVDFLNGMDQLTKTGWLKWFPQNISARFNDEKNLVILIKSWFMINMLIYWTRSSEWHLMVSVLTNFRSHQTIGSTLQRFHDCHLCSWLNHVKFLPNIGAHQLYLNCIGETTLLIGLSRIQNYEFRI